MRFACLTAAVLLAATAPLHAARYQFCWIGGAGYTMRGIIEIPPQLVGKGIITEADVVDFRIWGFHDGLPVGSWSVDQLTPTTTWVLRFDTDGLFFPTGGIRAENSYQAWNANGQVNDCGTGGFGFNGGNYMQDVCIDNTYIEASSIDRFTPLPAFPEDVPMACEAVVPVS